MFEKVKEIIVDTLRISGEDIKPESTLFEDLGADSLDAVELNIAVEEAFGLTIPDEDMQQFKTVQDIVTYVEQHQAA